MHDLTRATIDAIHDVKALREAYAEAERAAIEDTITDVLGKEWTRSQFQAIPSWGDILAASGLDGAIHIPSFDYLRNYGWIKYRVEEFELPEVIKHEINIGVFIATFEDGTAKVGSFKDWGKVTAGDTYEGKRITEIKECWPDFKGRRYFYHLV